MRMIMNADEKTADSPVRRGRRVTAVLFALVAFVLTVCGIYFNWEPWNVAWYERPFFPDNGIPVVVTYCPLCDSSEVFDRRTEIGKREFGVSGLLYNNNVLMYDRGGQPESLWSQVMASGVSGPANTKSLNALPLEVTTWKDWRSRHPDTKVVSIETGHDREYHSRPSADDGVH
jgi:hypothetical protein